MTKAYIHFTELFSRLNPYELKHLSECILCKLEAGFEDKLCGSCNKIELTGKDIKYSLTEAMQDIMVELRERELQLQRQKLNKTKAQVFADRKLAA